MSDPLMQHNTSMDHSSIDAAKIAPDQRQGFAWYVVFALGFALFIRFFIAAPYLVSGASMEPTFDHFDYLITDRLSYDFTAPERGDVVVFCIPHSGECSFVKRVLNKKWDAPRTLIKRVIGLPGETVSVSGTEVRIVNAENPAGFVLEEPYVDPNNIGGPSGTVSILGPGEYFVMGDNRRVSSDSRVWGVLPEENIVGHVVIRLFPFSSIGILPGAGDSMAQPDTQ
jgi:signal peptidase I